MFRFCLLGSGSSGNAILIVSPRSKILIDSGLSLRRLEARAASLGVDLQHLDAVVLTHEHGDHVLGLGPLARRYGTPVYLTAATHSALPTVVGQLPQVMHFEAGQTIRINDLELESFSVSHDAVDPVSFAVRCAGAQMGLATDVGHVSHLVRRRLSGSHALVLESNYCPEMLRRGQYPAQVQQRIRSRAGHLSNHDMCSLLSGLLHEALQTVVLVHISKNNNTPELARRLAEQALAGHKAMLHVAQQDEATPMFEVRGRAVRVI